MKKINQFKTFAVALGLLSALPLQSMAQQATTQGAVSGIIQDSQNQAVTFASVTLRKASDSSLVKGNLTDSVGKYHFAGIPNGKYFLRVMQNGFKTFYSNPVTLSKDNANISLQPIILKTAATNLKNIQITAAKQLIEHKPGETVVNVANSSLSAGNTVMEVLEKSPGVLVDQDDNISLNGKGGVMVMINGRPTHLGTKQLATILKNAPAASVEKIELMTQPPAKYSAEGTGGIINIVMKKGDAATGWTGSLTAGAGYGQYWKYNAGGNISYRGKKLSVYGSYNFNHRKNKMEMIINRDFYQTGTQNLSSSMYQNSLMTYDMDNHSAQLGLDYDINKKNSIGFVVNGAFNSGSFNSNSPVNFLDASGNTDSISTSHSHNGFNWKNESGNLHYNLKLDDKGSALTANVDYSHFYQTSPEDIHTQTTDASGDAIGTPIDRKGEQPNDINIYAAKLDYTQALKHKFTLEAGLKTSFVKTDNNSVFNIKQGGDWHNDPGNTNHFIYKENVNAAYLSLGKSFKKGWNAKVGVRAEQSDIQTNQLTTDSLNTQHYLDFFPNISLSKAINPNNVLSLSYTRRIKRPNYQSLNPFVYYVDEYTYQAGNPFLKPQYENNVALSYTFKHRYNATFTYSHTGDIMSQVLRQNLNTQVIYRTIDNISKLDDYSLALSIPVRITNWWQTYNSGVVSYQQYNGLYNGFKLDKGYATFMVNSYQSFILPKGWKAELSGFYRSGMIMGPTIVSPMGMVSAGISKSLWKGKATIKFNVDDIFQSLNFRGRVDFNNLHLHSKAIINRRSANLTFTWNFGNKKISVHQYKNTGIQKEENRIQKGNGSGAAGGGI